MKRKRFHFFQTILVLATAAAFIISAIGLLTKKPSAVQMLIDWNVYEFRNGFAIVELIIALALLWRPTRMIGSLIATAFLGGLIFLSFSSGGNPATQAILLLVVWIIHKMNWWRTWKHGYWCGCKACTMQEGKPLEGKNWCDCKDTCHCEKGKCTC